MKPIHLGSVRGIPVVVHWGAGAIVLILAFALGSGAFPLLAPGYRTTAYVLAGAIAGVGLLGSVFVHETAHAVVALRYDVPVKSIRLWILGGVAHLEQEAPHPKAEARIAGIGPLTSVIVGIVVGLAATGWLFAGGDRLFGMMLAWLAGTNGLLALFNLLPGLPLDGGRLLHAFLWKRRGDRAAATTSAARAGSVVGGLLIVIGGIEIVLGNFGGLWTAFIGWFLVGAARQEGAAARVDSAFHEMSIGQLMSPLPVEVPDWTPVRHLLEAPELRGRERFLAVDFDGEPTAIVVVAELPTRLAARQDPVGGFGVRLRDLGLPAPTKVDAATPAAPAIRAMAGPLVVTRNGAPVGVVTRSDVARFVTLRGMGLRPDRTLAADAPA